MTSTTSPIKRRSEGARIAFALSGTLIAVIAAAMLVGGGASLWLNGKKDSDGYVSTGDHRFHATSAAIVSDNLDVDLDGARAFFDESDLGSVKIKVAGKADKPVFAGVARTSDVERYLDGVATSTVTNLNYWPFDADYEDVY